MIYPFYQARDAYVSRSSAGVFSNPGKSAKTLEAAKALEIKLREALSEDIKNRKSRDLNKEERLSRLESLIKKAEYYNRIIAKAGLDAFNDQEKEDYENTFVELFFLI